MNARILIPILALFTGTTLWAQGSIVDQFRNDATLQDSIIAVIVSQHKYMGKLVNQVQKDPSLHTMLVQHLTRLLNQNGANTASGEHHHGTMMSQYAGDETREIKALSEAEIKGLQSGEGLGLAMPAELNHYPGPKHVLDMADTLSLTPAQKRTIEQSYATMHERAVRIGKDLIDRERSLDREFASTKIEPGTLRRLTAEIGKLRGELRSAHLLAHLETRAALSEQQIRMYDGLRGYGKGKSEE